jgi:hypothetical protein
VTTTAKRVTPTPRPELDVGPVIVDGRIRGRRARVLWTAGYLYVCLANNNVRRFPVAEKPTETGGVWTAVVTSGEVDDGRHIHFTRKGCPACGWQLGKLKVDRILAVGDGKASRATDFV